VTNRAIEPLLEAANVGNATRLLDVATGPGTLAAKAAERGARVIGKCYPKNIAAFVSTCRTRRNHRNTKISDLQQLGSCHCGPFGRQAGAAPSSQLPFTWIT
jgi:cyclopropane fatty-acyl-phospholipid synthase-like methyltransferase